MQPGKILIVDDDVDVLRAARLLLKRHFEQVDFEKNPQKIPYLVTNFDYDVILLDMNFTRDLSSGKEGFEWLDRILDIKPDTAVVLFTAYGDVEMAVRAIKAGATDFVLKPWENEKLLATIQTAYDKRNAKQNKPIAVPTPGSTNMNIIGKSPAMLAIFDTISRVAATDANILILGENGTGKDLLARQIHAQSHRSNKPFVSVDLGAISENLFESELFGHVKGAFTDAREDRTGRFEEANGGTIFLDEIGNISIPLQAKLLTVLQNRYVTKVGSNKPIPIDVRLICATNRNIQHLATQQLFRQDLLYRINTIEIQLPALRERKEDIVLLAEHFLQVYRDKYKRPVNSLQDSLINQLEKYDWPGNIRELQHAIERAVILAQGKSLQPKDVFIKNNQNNDQPSDTGYNLEEMERNIITQAMKKCNGNITEAAKELGLSRAALYRRLEKYNI
ncbi:DNA-binding transcriptional response regulator, NtrC family, contains REC, AAA-type ATPase, and a Fis-type DNA-binding domains [Chitinophaga terrae (ex Kim and Jung 2007)]|uniref:DNA-binding transcriptional response regulator, NtrC family, contains REC, AAA-type ATPase, and a Fis-type DNA-binding domains n=1 Tax=Chitinophaga terrae (ex Kim and Jung 2007) TaxID=408074 RepID=A0A1H3XQY9_9BACT|nr:sigma-54 dependent transcriptional regulator [Chitinophaga terrae (ex Kim and Jung 2007)]MDQ0105657.1 DNA-binding NtrC family response regulator [Chitinophaga terrae (ex Kim and Jung 2007)]GEP89331.1 sigma-54-dependent Fis family transcriptional regulator [Chitinophaga terrae (ex Kim and Jung 2007)]SEA01743.1 DNA-binding transcriptional response regulator, NtrC family, contains REC, AAA-type ATPase, and a Fis-type DNA-binding domains [Chitinophaga terrae (ex Kim and Jung 2007)]